MSKNDDFSLLRLRKALGLAQTEMAKRMGLSLRPYQQLESKKRGVRSRHIRLAKSVALDVAIEKENPELAPTDVRHKAIELVGMILIKYFRQQGPKLAGTIDRTK